MKPFRKALPLAIGWILMASGSAGASAPRIYTDRRLGLSFPVPDGWRAEACGPETYDEDREHCVLLWDSEQAPSESPKVIIHVRRGNLADGLQQQVLFEHLHGKWVKHGKFTTVDCIPIRARGWGGWYAIADCGQWDELGQHLGECLSAVISNGHRYADIETTGETDKDLVIDRVIRQFELLP
jgi:hypothetical protein